MACSLTHTIYLLSDGNVYTGGNNDYLQLGREGRTSVPGKVLSRISISMRVMILILSRPGEFTNE